MNSLLTSLVPVAYALYARLALYAVLAAALAGGYAMFVHHQRNIGREEVTAEWNADKLAREKATLAESEANAKESARRSALQQENQRAQDKELAAARDDARRNAVAADQLREQNSSIAKRWRDALDHPAVVGDRAAAADAIGVLADVLGRADRRAGVLATYADAARAAGLKCERDYQALTVKP